MAGVLRSGSKATLASETVSMADSEYSDESSGEDVDDYEQKENRLLTAAREGDLATVKAVLRDVEIDLNVKGHTAVAEHLLAQGAKVNIQNDSGDTPLHRAAHTGRTHIVHLLLRYLADVTIKNADGEVAYEVAHDPTIRHTLEEAFQAQLLALERQFIEGVRLGDVESVEFLLRHATALNLHCKDKHGNTGLHIASLAGHQDMCLLLVQYGLDPTVANANGKPPADLAKTPAIRQMLETVHGKALGFQGKLYRFAKVLRQWRRRWVVLEGGVLRFYSLKGEEPTEDVVDSVRLQNAVVKLGSDDVSFSVVTRTSKLHLKALSGSDRARWLRGLEAHNVSLSHTDRSWLHRACPQRQALPDLLAQARRTHHHAQASLAEARNYVASLNPDQSRGAASKALQVIEVPLKQVQELLLTVASAVEVLGQQEELWAQALKKEKDNRRLLEDSLHALAAQHNDLERAARKGLLAERQGDTGLASATTDDEFFDATEGVVYAEAPEVPGRTQLPAPMLNRNEISIWKILRHFVGKDLTRVSMPVVWNEPLSFLQRLMEDLEYCTLLDTASECGDSLVAMQHVAAFAVTTYSCTSYRINKPFNPLLAETYEYVSGNVRAVAEQVMHHPPISALHAHSPNYEFWQWSKINSKFWGKSMEFHQLGRQHLVLRNGHHYTWNKVTTVVNNVIVGALWLDNFGTMTLTNHTTGDRCTLHFRPRGWFGSNAYRVEGEIVDAAGTKHYTLSGCWNESLWCWADTQPLSFSPQRPDTATCLWKINPFPPGCQKYYHMTRMAMQLNAPPADPKALAPTDSRLRPDQRALESGDVDRAADEKNRLEEKQREARRKRAETSKISTMGQVGLAP